MFVSNVSFRHDLIVCLSKAVRDAVIQEKEHSISDKCRKQLKVEKKEEASQDLSFWRVQELRHLLLREYGGKAVALEKTHEYNC